MPTPTPPEISGPRPEPSQGIAEQYTLLPNLRDEMIAPEGALRPHWQSCVSLFDQMGPAELNRRWAHARQTIHENGVTHNVYSEPNGLDRPWELELIPLLIASAEWESLRQGLIQRARLLDSLLADLYGPMETVFGAFLPPELVWANAGFLRACSGIKQPGNRWLQLYAADLVRTPAGDFQVLSDRTQAPAGAGYALENRIALSRSVPAVFRQCNVRRLAPFFASLRETLASLAPNGRENPRIVLLTPGPYNESHFEHSYLAQYLGYPLVQGSDLTVRDTKVFLKTVGGLQQIDVIIRRVDDDFCDPLELYAGSHLGVPGLLQSLRQGHVAVANALGSGLLQAPGFLPFLPGLCRHLLGEELKLPSVPTWWCGQPAELQFVLDHLHEMVIKSAYPTRGADPIFGANLTREQRAELGESIKARPERFVAQNPAMSATAPSWIDQELIPRRFLVRAFLTAHGDSYEVMDGALTRITPSEESPVISLQHGGGSKDTWVLSEQSVTPVTLLSAGSRHIPFTRGFGDLPSRIADDLFWLGRYVERAEGEVRLARGAFRRFVEYSRIEENSAAQTLVAALQVDAQPASAAVCVPNLIHLLLESKAGGGLRETLSQIRGLVRILRDRLPVDIWRISQECDRRVSDFLERTGDRSEAWMLLLDDLITGLSAFTGLVSNSMMRSQSWRFLDMGRRIELTLSTAQLLGDTLVHPGSDPVLLEAVLEITESAFPYRRRYLMQLETPAVADLLIADEANPRSIAFQLARTTRHLTELPRDPRHPERDLAEQLLRELRSAIQTAKRTPSTGSLFEAPLDQPREALAALLARVSRDTEQLSNVIGHAYFLHAVSRSLHSSPEEPA
jgi:uncharacterized circularly permuted ATP-grasp superfamily protein/uncharacterized alpha-E superfamily protein